jgi:hypothetical protein
MSDDEFLAAFEGCQFARKEWTHEAHVRMAWLYLRRVSADEDVFERVRSGIKRLNAAFVRRDQARCMPTPRKEPDPRGLDGYHETITVAFVTVIASRMKPGEDFPTFRDRNPDLFDRKFPAILKHYSPERLFSSAAKAEFIEPDLEPLPEESSPRRGVG